MWNEGIVNVKSIDYPTPYIYCRHNLRIGNHENIIKIIFQII